MDYKELLQQIKEFLSACEQMRYGEYVGAPWPYNHDGPMVYTEPDAVLLGLASNAITDLLSRAEAAEARAEKAEREMDEAIQYMRKTFGWCTGCVHFTGIYGSGCKIGEMSTCGEENSHYVFGKEE